MNTPIRLSILDQSIVRKGMSARDALEETVETARLAERLGYHRFWVSEHHNSEIIAGSAPEILMVKLAEATQRLRIGSGGIMLPNHSALKVAENFRLLETLYPGRIDLGMGRAPGGDRVTASLLNPSNTFSEADYLNQLSQLQAYFHDAAETQYGRILAVPQSETAPAQWILSSSSGGSGRIAAQYGMGLAVARFINGFAGPDIVQQYRAHFRPSGAGSAPEVLLAIGVLCAETEEQARRLRKQSDYFFIQFERGLFIAPPAWEMVKDYEFTPTELEIIRRNSGRIVSGTPQQVRSQLTELAEAFGVDELMVTTMTHSRSERARSFELLAETFAL